jgi:hypothetical protein
MMARFRLVGEGPDDVAVFVALIRRYGLPLADKGKESPDKMVVDCPGGDAAVLRTLRSSVEDKDRLLLEHVQTFLKPRDLTSEDRLAIVVDADHPRATDPDDGFRRRWVQLKETLKNLGYTDIPAEPDRTGTIVGMNQVDRPRVGVWMMPDNQSPGKLEDFARRLVKSGDEALWDHAGQATSESASKGAKFAAKDQTKAHIHTFLAWQEVPGVPMGLAITKQFLAADSSDARNFVGWLCRLYGFTSPRLGPP